MKLLFLRGKVPSDRDPSQIMFDNLDDCDDMWTNLASAMTKKYGEVWYWGGRRKVKYRKNFVERWIPNFGSRGNDFQPDVVFARGGFPEYDQVLRRNKKAFKIYYGAGKRFYPQSSPELYDLILNDTPKQAEATKKILPKARVELWTKPAADNIFKPVTGVHKKYDVIMVGNEHKRGIKGHDFAFDNVPRELSMLQVGIASKGLKKKNSHITFTNWIPRNQIPRLYAQSKVAIVCVTSTDSCPRVIPEALACNCPLLVLDRSRFWHEKYINSNTGKICSEGDFKKNLIEMVSRYKEYKPYEYYREVLSLSKAAEFIDSLVRR